MSNSLKERIQSFDPKLPLSQASTIPSSWYTDSAIYELERKAVYLNAWLCVGRTDQLSKACDFFTAEVAGEPLVISRDQEGRLHAFSNVCRHRAARVVKPIQGNASHLRCQYHGWTYDITGQLKGTPEFDGVENFCREKIQLPQWHVDTWGPLIFVTNQSNPVSLRDFLSPLPSKTDRSLESMKFFRRVEYSLQCNWKLFVDNYLDGGYHVNTIHPALAGVIDYSQYRIEISGNTSVQVAPLKPPEKAREKEVAQVRAGTGYYWWIYPNLMINIYEGLMDTNLVIPQGHNRCLVQFDYYFSETDGENKRAFIEKSIEVAHQIQLEDLSICEDVQRGLSSSTFSTGRFSAKREGAGYHFHKMLSYALNKAV